MRGTSDILGHRRPIERLWNALARDALHHAYLFEGPEGVGKHLVATRLAQAANCEDPGEDPPCGVCPSCRAIAAGTFTDVVEVGPDPERKTPIITVDQVREVVRQVGYHRYNGKRRFVIVDPAEAMQASGANALLKTLEEPPEGTGFVLVANHASALLPTIVSRCQRVRFSAVPEDDVEAWLRGRGVEEAGALARASMGRPGAALTLAEGALVERGVLRDQVLALLGDGDLGRLFDLSKSICSGDRQEYRPRVEALIEVIEDMLRDAAVVASGSEVGLLDPAHEHVARQLGVDLWPTGISRVARAVEEAREGIVRNVAGRTVVEALLARLAAEVGALR